MKYKNQLNKRIFNILLVFIVAISSFLLNAKPILSANQLQIYDNTGYTYRGISGYTGQKVDNDPLVILQMDGEIVFCIESGMPANSGQTYMSETYVSSKKDILSKIAYYGYTNTSKTKTDYAVTQLMMWEELGDRIEYQNIPNYYNRKAEINAQIKKHNTVPSWHNTTIDVPVGKDYSISDSNAVLKDMEIDKSSIKGSVNKSNNNLTIKLDNDANNGEITFKKIANKNVGTSIVYKRKKNQSMVKFFLESNVIAKLKVRALKYGSLRVTKIDEDTQKPLANAKLRFEYDGKIRDIVTGPDGYATIKDVLEGTVVKITEVTAPNGFYNKGEIKTATIKAHKTIEVTMKNTPQKGVLKLNKTGKKAIDVVKKDSEYGDVYEFVFDYMPLKGVTYDIEAIEDIVVGSTTHFKKGDLVTSVTTDSQGNLINMPKLYLGSYQAIEKSAPAGTIINSKPIEFKFEYEGQTIELVTHKTKQANEFQKLKLSLYKDEEIIKDWNKNKPVIEKIKANDKVFGLFINEDMKINDDLTIPKDSLLSYEVVKDGTITLNDLQYPEGMYYFLELDSGENHKLNLNKYEFEFKPEDNNVLKEIDVSNPDGTPIVNELHFNSFSLKKINEKATLVEKEGYKYDYTDLAKGAVFTLEDESKKVIQTITVNDLSVADFDNVPVGTYYLREKKPSSDNFILSEKIYRIESSKEGIKVYDEANTLLAEQTSNDKPIILFELKNHLIKGGAKLIKIDAKTKEVLPNTGVRIRDKDKKIVVEGRTDKQGVFEFGKLPKGTYYFQEYEAPSGYRLNKKLIKFKIKEDGKVVVTKMKNRKIVIKLSLPKTGDSTGVNLLIAMIVLSTSFGLIVNYNKKLNFK